jgi:pSer/pThr/pTyr-binding forkhead associated (FHA) protein
MGQPHRKAATYFLYNNRSREFVEIQDGWVIGRSDGDIRFPKDDLVSMRHCRFTVAGNEIYVEDFGSTNKTRVNSVPIQPGRRRRLRLNDTIETGAQMLVLTNQNREKPAHTHDAHRKTRPYKAVVNTDGSLEPYVTQVMTKKTLVDVNWVQFQLMKLKRATAPARRATDRKKSRFSALWAVSSLLGVLGLGMLSLQGYSLKDLADFIWRLW